METNLLSNSLTKLPPLAVFDPGLRHPSSPCTFSSTLILFTLPPSGALDTWRPSTATAAGKARGEITLIIPV